MKKKQTEFEKIINLGVDDSLPQYLQSKIKLSNQLALVAVSFIGIPFTIVSLIFFKPLVVYPAVGIIVALFVFILNYFKQTTVSRVLISILPFLLTAAYTVSVQGQFEVPPPSLLLLALGFSTTPFLVFDLREKNILTGVIVFIVITILSYYLLNKVFGIELENKELIYTGWLSYLATILSLMVFITSLFILLFNINKEKEIADKNFESANKNIALAKEREEELKLMLDKIKEAQEEDKKREWQNIGLSKLNDILRANEAKDTSGFYMKILHFIIKYVGLNQGGMFLLDGHEEDLYLNCVACYAYDRKKYNKKKIGITEGLIGQCFYEKDIVIINEMPQNYINITSGLGDAPPDYLALFPLINNEEIIGVLEFATFGELDKYKIEFLKKGTEAFASTINNLSVNEKMKELLNQTQQQTEELMAQEEEIRQNMEELETTKEELQQKLDTANKYIEELKK